MKSFRIMHAAIAAAEIVLIVLIYLYQAKLWILGAVAVILAGNVMVDVFWARRLQRLPADAGKSTPEETEGMLTALQNQINPHFLYNTLDTIRGKAIADENRDISDMLAALSSYCRYSIGGRGNTVTLREELQNVQSYMNIMRCRFGDRYRLEIEIDEEENWVLDAYVPRMILQPIIENAVHYGLADKLSDGCIIIDIAVADDLILTVSDNGRGMSTTQLDKCNARIRSCTQSLCEEEEGSGHTGIGLRNVQKRITLLYGEKYGLRLYSAMGQGTDVQMILPVDHEAK